MAEIVLRSKGYPKSSICNFIFTTPIHSLSPVHYTIGFFFIIANRIRRDPDFPAIAVHYSHGFTMSKYTIAKGNCISFFSVEAGSYLTAGIGFLSQTPTARQAILGWPCAFRCDKVARTFVDSPIAIATTHPQSGLGLESCRFARGFALVHSRGEGLGRGAEGGPYSYFSDVCEHNCYCIRAKSGPEPQIFGVCK